MFPNLTRRLHSVSRKPHVFVNTIRTANILKIHDIERFRHKEFTIFLPLSENIDTFATDESVHNKGGQVIF